jgi:hypothetical protein
MNAKTYTASRTSRLPPILTERTRFFLQKYQGPLLEETQVVGEVVRLLVEDELVMPILR